MIRRPPRSTLDRSSAASDVYKRQIQQLSFADNRFAFLMCNHVLEHIPDDGAALRECARVLVPGGLAVFTMPGDYHKQQTRVLDTPDAVSYTHLTLPTSDLV